MPICKILDTHVCVQLPGYYKPCCQYETPKGISAPTVNDMSHKEYTQTSAFQQIKKDMETGWHIGCEKCRLDETKNNIESLRQISNRNFDEKLGIQFLEINLSNKCNLACKMCNPQVSSKWEKILQNNKTELSRYFSDDTVSMVNIEKYFKDIDISNLTTIKYLGGEPFITPETKQLFDYLEMHNIMQNVMFTSNTNCTFFPEKWIDAITKFKTFSIGLSIDGWHKSCEYSRTNSKWSVLLENVRKWKRLQLTNKNVRVHLSTTVSALTVHDLGKLKKFANSIKLGISPYVMHQPSYLKLEALPPEYIKSILDDDNKQYLQNVKFDPILFEQFKKFIQTTDAAQNIKIKDYIPELAKYLNK